MPCLDISHFIGYLYMDFFLYIWCVHTIDVEVQSAMVMIILLQGISYNQSLPI